LREIRPGSIWVAPFHAVQGAVGAAQVAGVFQAGVPGFLLAVQVEADAQVVFAEVAAAGQVLQGKVFGTQVQPAVFFEGF
jgi:hypothetical protein